MTKQEILARINELDKEQFLLMMKDMWDRRDYARDAELGTGDFYHEVVLDGVTFVFGYTAYDI